MGDCCRQRRLDDARQCPRADPLRRRRRRLRSGRGHGPASECRAVHPARRLAPRDRQRPLPDRAPARSLAPAGARSRPRQACFDDRDDSPSRSVRRRGPHPQGRDPRTAGGEGRLKPIPPNDTAEGANSPNKRKQIQGNARKKAWISLDSFGQNGPFQRVKREKIKNFLRASKPVLVANPASVVASVGLASEVAAGDLSSPIDEISYLRTILST